MAVTLTKSWQKVAETYIGYTGYNDVYIRCYAKYNSQSTENNKTNVSVESRIYVSGGTFWSNSGTYGYATVNGDTASSDANRTYYAGENVIASKTKDVEHNQDGSKTIGVSSRWHSDPWGWDVTASTNVVLPKIDRYPMIITAPDFSDEDDPTVTFTTTLGFTGATVEIGIFDSTGNTNYVPYKTISDVSTGSYTFHLDNTERNALTSATPNSNTMDVMFKLRTTTANNTEYLSTSIKQLRIVNANPTMTYTITETAQKVIDLLGTSANTIVQNVSVLNFNVIPTTYKNATVQKVLCGNRYDIMNRISKTTSPYSIDIPVKTENTFIVVVFDSRNNQVYDDNIEKTIIEYQPVDITSLSVKRYNPTSSNIIINLEATYYQKTFGSTANVPIVKWKLGDGNYTTIPSTEYTIDTTNNKLTISNYTLTNVLDYRTPGQFTLYIEDLLTNDTEGGQSGYVTKGIPTFDAGEHDLKVNGKIYLADEDGQNPVEVGQGGDTLPINAIVEYDGNTVPEGYEAYNPTFKFKRYEKSITLGANAINSFDMGSVSAPTGYTLFGIVPHSVGYGDQFLVSYSFYNSKVVAMARSKYSSSLTNTLVCYVIFVKTDEYNEMLIT